MINKFLHSNLFLLIFDLDFDRIQLAESLRIFLKVDSDFIQDTEPILSFIFPVAKFSAAKGASHLSILQNPAFVYS